GKELSTQASVCARTLGEDADILFASARYDFANRVSTEAVKITGEVSRDLTERIDRIVLHRVLGIPIFLLMMYLMFLFTIKIGGAFIDFFDQAFGALFVDGLGQALLALGLPEWLKVVLADGVGSGIQTVATFIPIIGFLYVFLSVLEDSGYMARAAFVMDRFMRWVGLPGKSFVPLIVGFGCNVPAVMATRTLEQHRDRLMTIAMAPFMSCGARLPVYVLFAAAFFPHSGQNVVFALYLLGIAVAVLTGLTLRHSLLAGEAAPFVMELPPYHLPTVGGVLIHSYRRLKEFIWRAGRVIVPMVLVLNFLNAAGTDGTYGNQDSENSVLAAIGRTIAPAFSPLGLDEENWPAAVGIFTGVLAKEAVVGTLDATYTALARQDAGEEEDEAPFVLTEAITAAFATIPENLASAIGEWRDPMGVTVGDLTDSEALAEKDVEVAASTFGAMAARFHGAAGAMAYLIFILLYAPCTAAIATVAQEAGLRWAAFVTVWTTGMGYGVATLYYQWMNWHDHPAASAFWIGLISAGFVLVFLGLRRYGRGGGNGGTRLTGGDVLQRA
ncbi:MAG: ferrous iron transport protein B, partial [Ottowia sp.]|nr:ferrous iron transport protein B [Ottowia sp.]